MPSYFEKNMIFLNSTYEKFQIPKEYNFLLKYFKTRQQRAFLKYYYLMREVKNFTNHTGIPADESFKYKLSYKFHHYIDIYEKAKSNMDFEKLSLLNARRIKLEKRFL